MASIRFAPSPEKESRRGESVFSLPSTYPSLHEDEVSMIDDIKLLGASIRSLSGLMAAAEEGGESKEAEYEYEEEEEEEEVEYEGDEDGEEPAVRPLGGFERFFGAFGQLGLGMIYMVADLNGPVCPDMLARAMRMNVKRHPNLRSHLVPGGQLKTFPFSRCPKVKVQSVVSEDVLVWTETTLNTNEKVKQGRELYMWSLHLHYTPSMDQHHLVLFMHHAISDGDSINHLLQSLVEQMDKQLLQRLASRSRLIKDISTLPLTTSADNQLLGNYQGLRFVSTFRTLFQQAKKSVFQKGRVPEPIEKLSFADRSTCISSFTMQPADLKRVLKACKTEGTTLTGAIAAAAAQEMELFINRADQEKKLKKKRQNSSSSVTSSTSRNLDSSFHFQSSDHTSFRHSTSEEKKRSSSFLSTLLQRMSSSGEGSDKEYNVRVDVLVNFRGKIATDAKTAESHQLFAAPVDILLKAGSGDKNKLRFWEAARCVRRQVVQFMEEPHQVIDTLGLMNTLGGTRFGVRKMKKIANGPRQGRSRAISISNLGVTDKVFVPTNRGFAVGKTQWGIDEGFVGHSIFLAVSSYQGALNFTLSYAPSIFTRDMAQEFGEGVMECCLAACPPLEG